MTSPLVLQAAYDAVPAVNWSALKYMRESPLEYRYRLTHRDDKPAWVLGRATHAALYEPDVFADHYVVYPGPVRRGKAWDAFKAEHDGDEILTAAERTEAAMIADAVRSNPNAARYIDGGYVEQRITWTDAITGLACKGRTDEVNGRVIDLKTTRNIDARRFAADVARFGYHCQAAFYQDGLEANGVTGLDSPVLIAVQNQAPYDVAVYELPDVVVEQGRAEYRRLLEQVLRCTEHNEWPGVAPDTVQLTLPAWAVEEEDDVMPTAGGAPMF
ncbi:MAG TPA: PD-(D/E)XK nuclease-like domain-containing protein [Phycisphaerae bacterium]|nr:PD-(D/E)XK nuclease-like domain-containing protein [Phycisphaerae bacterium]